MSVRGPAVIDWMTAARGNPIADVARTTLLFRSSVLPAGTGPAKRLTTELFRRAFLSAYLRAYGRLRPFPVEEIETWMPILAAARLDEHIAEEEAHLVRLAESVCRERGATPHG
jgi:thiamine kinase